MVKKIGWNKTLKKWKFSENAKIINDRNEIGKILKLLNFAADNFNNVKIGLFQVNPLEKIDRIFDIIDDEILQDRILIEASRQLNEHNQLARTHLDLEREKHGWLTYEMPFVLIVKDQVKYFKFQFSNNQNVLDKPEKLNKIYMNYHETKLNLEVFYEN
ncbi:MAG: hypothetical protein ACUZ8O_06210 [Candidatus Anammoxibacter sp.]